MVYSTLRTGLLITLLAMTSGRAEAGQLLGISWNSAITTLYDVDISNGRATNPRDTKIVNLIGIAFDGVGTLFGVTTFGGEPANSLVIIDPITGASTTVGPVANPSVFSVVEGDIAFDPTSGILYGVGSAGASPRALFAIDTATGTARVIGSIGGVQDPSGMAFDASGNLLILDTGGSGDSHLVTVDKATAQILSSVALSQSLGNLAGMAFDPAGGALYVADGGITGAGGTDNLYTLDRTSGNLSLVGPTGLLYGLAGLTRFEPTTVPVPEPSTLVTGIGMVVLGLAYARSRRSSG